MERFAKRKVMILTGRKGDSLAWFCPDHGEKIYMGAYNSAMTSDAICEAVKRKLYQEAKTKMAACYGSSVSDEE